ncbi:MAG: hypothetical protein QOD92_793 [Acidimicrobiaceae bacterium]|jgi:hypothetical protein
MVAAAFGAVVAVMAAFGIFSASRDTTRPLAVAAGASGSDSPESSSPTSTSTTSTTTTAIADEVLHVSGAYDGLSDFAVTTRRCSLVDTVWNAVFVLDTGESWAFHNEYCGTITDGLFTGSGPFTLTQPDGATLTGRSQTTDVPLVNNGGPTELHVTGGTAAFTGASGSCLLDNTVENFEFGHQHQFGTFTCDINVAGAA